MWSLANGSGLSAAANWRKLNLAQQSGIFIGLSRMFGSNQGQSSLRSLLIRAARNSIRWNEISISGQLFVLHSFSILQLSSSAVRIFSVFLGTCQRQDRLAQSDPSLGVTLPTSESEAW